MTRRCAAGRIPPPPESSIPTKTTRRRRGDDRGGRQRVPISENLRRGRDPRRRLIYTRPPPVITNPTPRLPGLDRAANFRGPPSPSQRRRRRWWHRTRGICRRWASTRFCITPKPSRERRGRRSSNPAGWGSPPRHRDVAAAAAAVGENVVASRVPCIDRRHRRRRRDLGCTKLRKIPISRLTGASRLKRERRGNAGKEAAMVAVAEVSRARERINLHTARRPKAYAWVVGSPSWAITNQGPISRTRSEQEGGPTPEEMAVVVELAASMRA